MKRRFSTLTFFSMVLTMTLMGSCSPEDGEDGAIGPQGPQGEQGIQGPPGIDGVDGADGTNGTNGADGAVGPQGDPAPTANYFERSGLNNTSVTADTTPAPIGPILTIEKEFDDTRIETILNSRVESGTFSGTNGIRLSIRINGSIGQFGSEAAITTSNTVDFLSIFDVFENLPAGTHEVQVYVRAAPSGTSTGVILDPGGWGGRIIAKETY